MADYTQLGSFNTGGASSLNGELIQKLYDAEEKSKIKPLDTSLELIETETTLIGDINTKVNELIASIKPFDLFTTGNNAFEQVSASTTGEGVIFDAPDVGSLSEGTRNIKITQLAQKDSYQSKTISEANSILDVDQGDLTITTNSGATETFDTNGKTYKELAEEINLNGTFEASLEKVSDTEYRLLIKSKDVGTANTLTLSGAAATALEYNVDVDGNGKPDNRVLKAQNLNATIDGVQYDVSSNSITLDGNLKITASKIGESSISIQKDDSQIVPAMQEFASKYNELLLMITEEVYSADGSSQNKSALNSIVNDIKNTMFNEFGVNDDSLLNYGFSFDKSGVLSIDSSILGKALSDDPEKVKALFIGVAEDKGFGTQLKETLDDLNSYNGVFDTYENGIASRKKTLEEDKEQAVKDLDTKYDTMAAQFAAYASVISQMESSFAGLKAIIASENSSN